MTAPATREGLEPTWRIRAGDSKPEIAEEHKWIRTWTM